jgi:hypothetical protein
MRKKKSKDEFYFLNAVDNIAKAGEKGFRKIRKVIRKVSR